VSRPAAGRAGGRAAVPHPVPPRARTPVRRRWRVAAVAAGLLAAATTTGGAAAAADPPTAAPPGNGDPDRPVTIDVSRLEPRTVADGSRVTVTGTLTNTGASAVRDIEVRLQRGEVMTTRAELVAADADPDEAAAVVTTFEEVPGILAPGEWLPFSYSVEAEELALGEDGVYPLLVNVNATTDEGLRERVGELQSFLVHRPAVPEERTTVAWLWPIAADSSRSPTGGFADDELARSVSPGGRLDRALAVLERLPAGEGQEPALPVTLAVDPALVEELGIMAGGPYTVGPDDVAGQGTDAAANFLGRLRELAAVHLVVALPYGDVDGDALTAVGLADVLTRSLPGTPAGTAQGTGAAVPTPPEEVEPTPEQTADQEPTATPDPTADGGSTDAPDPTSDAGTGGNDDAAGDEGLGAGARILTDALGVAPRTDLAWAAGGSFREATVATLLDGGVGTLVLGPSGLSAGQRLVGLEAGAAAAAGRARTDAGEVGVLVADTGLGAVVHAAEDWPGGPRVAEQRYLAELALIGQQSPDGSTATVLVAPPREVVAGPDGAGAMMADVAGLPWLTPTSLGELEASRPADAGRLTDPADAVLLDEAGLADVVAAERTRDDLAEAVVGEPDEVLSSYDAATARTVSVSHREEPEDFRSSASGLRTAVGRLLDRVSLLAPADGTYSLASRDAPLPLTVQNDLPFSVSVQVALGSDTRSIAIGDIGPQTLAPGERQTLEVPTEVRQSGTFSVSAALTTPGGTPLGKTVRLQVKSTAYGTISLLITFGAAGLLGLLFLRRLVRFLIRRRRAAPEQIRPGAPEGAAVAVPPTRSPV
jgi:hypothetical protein